MSHSRPARTAAAAALALAGALALSPSAAAAPYPGPNGTKDVRGLIEVEWQRLGGAGGVLGPPLSDETPTPARPGAFSSFEGGAIYYSPATGAHEVRGAFYQFWAAQGWENGRLGFPRSNEIPVAGGVVQFFEGAAMYWSPRSGAHSITGDFYDRYAGTGSERGPLGFPTTERAAAAASGSSYQGFTGGGIYTQGPASFDVSAYSVSGAFYRYWGQRGYERGRLGFPLSQEYRRGGAVAQDFVGGRLLWTPRTGVTES